MHYYSESEIRDIIESVVTQAGGAVPAAGPPERPIPVEVSARHVHLTQEAVERLFGPGYRLTQKRELSQHGEFLSGERVKIVTAKGEFSHVAVLGPVRSAVQVELSMTDCKRWGPCAGQPVGNLEGAADVLLIGPCGIYQADRSAIVAKAHIHMTAPGRRQPRRTGRPGRPGPGPEPPPRHAGRRDHPGSGHLRPGDAHRL